MSNVRIFGFADETSSAIDNQITAMLRNNLCGLEIRNVDGTNVSDITLDKAKEVKAKLDANGLITWSIGSPIGKINITDDFAPHLDKFKHTLEVAHALDCQNIRLFSFFMPMNEDVTVYKDEVLERLSKFIEAAKGSGIDLCHENEKGIYGDIAERCAEIHKALPELKAVFDPANFVQCGEDTLKAWELLSPFVKYMHIKDAKQSGTIVPAGEGDGNVKKLAALYRENGGSVFTMEPHLTVFEGLKSLEREGEESNIAEFSYPDADTAFDVACNTFKALL